MSKKKQAFNWSFEYHRDLASPQLRAFMDNLDSLFKAPEFESVITALKAFLKENFPDKPDYDVKVKKGKSEENWTTKVRAKKNVSK